MTLIDCDICGAMHPEEFDGDCRDNSNRYFGDEEDEEMNETGNILFDKIQKHQRENEIVMKHTPGAMRAAERIYVRCDSSKECPNLYPGDVAGLIDTETGLRDLLEVIRDLRRATYVSHPDGRIALENVLDRADAAIARAEKE